MSYHQFVIEGQDPRQIEPLKPINSYAQMLQETSFVHGFYTGAVIGFCQKLVRDDRDIETLEDISFKEAKVKIKSYFEERHGELIEYSDLMDRLKISLPLIVEVCGELEKEGEIAPID